MSECPSANEFGVRSNPVCVDSVDTTLFTNITNIDFTDISSVTGSSGNIAVSACIIIIGLFYLTQPASACLQTLLELISTEQCAPYYIASTAGIELHDYSACINPVCMNLWWCKYLPLCSCQALYSHLC